MGERERERAVRIADGYSGVFSATFRSNYKTAEVMDVATGSSGVTGQSPDEDREKISILAFRIPP